MLSVELCKNILIKNGLNVTSEEAEKIRDFLYCLGELDYQIQKKTNAKSTNLH